MNALVENGIISEMECGNNFAYIINDSNLFLSTEYKVLQSQEEGCFVKCMKLLYNGKIQFYYLVNGYKSLANMFSSIDADGFMTIMTNVFSSIISVQNNGFLSCQNIDISFERIYVDPNTYKVALIYLPVSKRFFQDEASFENELRTSLVKVIFSIFTFGSPITTQFMADLSNGMLTVKDLYEHIRGGKSHILTGVPPTRERVNNSTKERHLRIIAMNAPTRVEVVVTKDNFVIGKNAAAVDGAVTFNKMISRIHCRITNNQGRYMIADLKSANGTYVNRVRLVPNQPHPIQNGDIIRLADSDFQVVID